MKFTCEKEKLLNALTLTSRTVSTKSNIVALEGILLDIKDNDVTLTGYNMETGIQATIPAFVESTGRLVLSSRLLVDIIRAMPNQEITFETRDVLVNITCGQIEFEVLSIDHEEYPDLPDVSKTQGFTISQEVLKSMIGATLFAISKDNSRPIHTGSLFEMEGKNLRVVSVDGYRLALRKEEVQNVFSPTDFSCVVPGSALSEVEKICKTDESVTVSINPKHVLFQFTDCILVTRRLEGEFISYRSAIPQDNTFTVTVNRRELSSAVDRVSLMISDKLKKPMRCFFREGTLELSSKTAMGGAQDFCSIEGHGGDLEIGINHRYMQEALRAVPADKLRIEYSTAVNPCLILPEEADNDKFCYMVLPVRLKAD